MFENVLSLSRVMKIGPYNSPFEGYNFGSFHYQLSKIQKLNL